MPSNSLDATLDASAIGLSGLCLVHCLLLPVAAALLPALAFVGEAEWLHLAFVAVALPLAGLALVRAHRRRPLPPALFGLAAAGLSGLGAGALGWPTHALETPLTVGGSLALASAHLWNWRRRPHARCAG
ncbi:MerC domain-containing protein [Luteimonas kalidii]|uniref:MerC domain-containing protein n=1 Tax=Luteimonas kalidii TaxID=3042025 RepID=A0ABT6JPG2_9GAMM|nr:MerC domain-containing protein [Luteimonas kalidii]MDH5832395.1 MerC domain-containing protein [Luteimonas kalidii]